MLDPNQYPEFRGIEPALRVQQILVGSLLMGLLMFSGVVIYLRSTGSTSTPPSASSEQLLLIVMGVLTLVTLVAGFVIKRLHTGQMRKLADDGVEFDDRTLMGRYSTLNVLRAALAEGPGLFGAVVVMISGNLLGFIGTAVGAAVLLLVLPTRGKFDAFVRDATGEAPEI
jgi:hypothetical protein